ncbi:MAG: UvrD-helicase domain-containing protein [Clostridia bacterium]|nr:UvrD-helicase domain-containing protein [Clostridia bacterium]
MNYDLSTLNEQQLAPLLVTEGAVLVTAGAGSGKTRLLTHRVAYLIKEKNVSPYNILAITFTNKAAGEMKERIAGMVDGAANVWISTFHSMCAKILRMDIASMPPFTKDFSIYSENDSEKVLKEVCAARGGDDKLKKLVGFHLSNWKNGVMSLGDYLLINKNAEEIEKVGACINDYQKRLEKNNALDFDDLLCKTYQLFKTCPQVLAYYANRFQYILVDEFQDTNAIQYELVKLLASVHGNVFAVGDEDQCIYSWRGANFKNIFNFKNDFDGAQVFKLEQNYRSSPEIIAVANNVIKNNTTRLNKNMYTTREKGQVPQIYNAYDERDEALYVAQNISKLVAQGYHYDDMAVLMRMNALSRSFEEAFLSYNIPHRIFGGFKFYERVEIRNLIAYLRLFVNPKDDVSFARIINIPKRGIGDGTLAKLQAIEQKRSLLENCLSRELEYESALYKKFQPFIEAYNKVAAIPQSPLADFVEEMIKIFNIRSAYNPKDEEDLNRLMNIEQFISSVKEYSALNPEASLGDFLENITLSSENDEIGQGGAVTIATVHAVKGLEFKVVFIIGLEDGIFPLSRSMNSSAELEEERRLMYVAITRAEEVLHLTQCSRRYLYGGSQYQMPSRFCRELGLLSVQEKKNSSPSLNRFTSNAFGNSAAGSYGGLGSTYTHSESEKPKKFSAMNFVKEEKKEEKPARDISVYHVGQKVSHPKYGEGEIVDITPDGLVGDIIFEDFGKKSLMLELAPLEIID